MQIFSKNQNGPAKIETCSHFMSIQAVWEVTSFGIPWNENNFKRWPLLNKFRITNNLKITHHLGIVFHVGKSPLKPKILIKQKMVLLIKRLKSIVIRCPRFDLTNKYILQWIFKDLQGDSCKMYQNGRQLTYLLVSTPSPHVTEQRWKLSLAAHRPQACSLQFLKLGGLVLSSQAISPTMRPAATQKYVMFW